VAGLQVEKRTFAVGDQMVVLAIGLQDDLDRGWASPLRTTRAYVLIAKRAEGSAATSAPPDIQ